MSNIFLSYNRKSEAVVRTLADDIEALGHNAWFDQDLSGGQAWWEQILENVRGQRDLPRLEGKPVRSLWPLVSQ